MKIHYLFANTQCFYICLLSALNLALICCSLNITVLHNNDFHTHFEAINVYSSECKSGEQCYGGIARMVTKVKEIQSEANTKNVLFLNGGDHFQGTIWYTIMKWKVVANFVRLMDHDVMALGNHEFDDGVEGLLPFVKNMTQNNDKNLTIVCSNIETSGQLGELVVPSVVLERQGIKIAIIGYITPETAYLSQPGETVKFNDEIESIRNEIQNLKQKYENDLNIFIAVGHSGFERDQQIAKSIPDLDLVVGGHTNTFLYTGAQPSIEVPEGEYPVVFDHGVDGKTLVVQAFAYGKYLGRLDVVFDDNGIISDYSGNPILLDNSTLEDPEVLAEVNEWKLLIDEEFKEQIGFSSVHLSATGCREKECNAGNLLADSFVTYFTNDPNKGENSWTSVAMAVSNGGAVRSDISAGNITLKDVISLSPFGNTLGVLKLSGESLWDILQYSASQYKLGGFLQVSGIRYEFDSSAPIGQRLLSVRVRCTDCMIPSYEDLDQSKTYMMAITEYLVNGGDNYTMINKSDYIRKDIKDFDVLSTHVTTYSPIITAIEDRIVNSGLNSAIPSTPQTTPDTSNAYSISSYFKYNLIIVSFCLYQPFIDLFHN